MAKGKSISPTWSDVKAVLLTFDRAGLQGLVQDLYAASEANQAFLHARFGLGQDQLEPYKKCISRWICPDIMRAQPVSVSKAKKAIADYKKAIGRPEGMAELSIFYCEEALSFHQACGFETQPYLASLIHMFDQALKSALSLPPAERSTYLDRLDRLRARAKHFGGGVQDQLNSLWYDAHIDE